MPLFSVIVPIYNIEDYLDQCVRSVLGQTFRDFEVILVDDGSPDRCPEMCDRYAEQDERVRTVHRKNGGLVYARQSGVAAASGKYVVCVDGDDWISPDYLERFAEASERYGGADVICCGSFLAYGDRYAPRPICARDRHYDRGEMEREIFPTLIEDARGRCFPPSLWAKAFRRDIYQQQQQQVDCLVMIGEDHACSKPTIYHSHSLVTLAECLYYYRQNVSSMTRRPKPFLWDGPMLIGTHMERQIPMDEFDFQDQVYRLVTHGLFNVASSQCNRGERYAAVRRDILAHIRDPYYRRAVERCRYAPRALKFRAARFCLQRRLILPIYLYGKAHWRPDRR